MGVISNSNGIANTSVKRAPGTSKQHLSIVAHDSTGLGSLWTSQRRILLTFAASLMFLICYILRPIPPPPQAALAQPKNFHILIPASKEDENLCKVLLSAAILGYPSPVLINWNKTFDDPGLVEGGSHLAKISGAHQYLSWLDESHNEDLVLVVDAYDIWMQLRPQTLLNRYFAINSRANSRIRTELGAAADKHDIRQEIVFGCQKRCWPWTLNDPPCYAVPESTLPRDIYGPQTDTDVGNEQNPFIKNRQRFLNSGVGIGTVRAMRKLFEQALAQAEEERNFGSDQYVLSHIFGDQELWREIVRRDSLSVGQRLKSRWSGTASSERFPEAHINEVRMKAESRYDKNFEFGIGVDYGSEIGLNTVFAEDDTAWFSFDKEDNFINAQLEHGISPPNGHLSGISADISETLPPFWTYSNERDLPRWRSWSNVSLLTDVWTGITPAVIHHNAHRDGLKSRRRDWWPNMFFHEHARTLLDAHIYAPVVPVASSGHENHTTEYWPYETWKGGSRNGISELGTGEDDNWVRFENICRAHHEEIFRDGKGAWELPDNH
ncbi:hypothetical protein LTR37_010737 [Vermiconidia calcicola]|uniref:Uncharacterized protein n=1 Tax=Vermiconidia calcicola TaxID=1690605 RepID=A0ACC3N473_9PEZI|nr:hypothetical protein LTR37_010737 [Vermiconidia calcicola]